ncbi:hypothetical protein [Mucilaginibacter sp. 5C4]|uniref:hypothetical protein n=1 Tax=Mucilaginibacter sp. 5C4 TaxID=3048589 RepID=UPI002AC989A2|nr:hypothetical protein [Mucilaginibacter sp. 5C4]MEB0302362.1 hypothetical protein [Mucilaginibacter sp. 5C4]WPX22146.1 hypothetical protein RHM67_12725 [Mucilaginibacter sp. 5C4]
MSIFSFLGKGAKLIGKAALGVVGSSIGLSGLSNVFDKKTTSNAIPAPAMVAPSLNIGTPPNSNYGGKSLGSTIVGMFDSITDFLQGRSHAQLDVNVGTGGRASDGYNTTSGLPRWLLPVALGGIAILFLSKSGSSRRY